MKFLIVKPSPLPILMLLGPNIRLRMLFLNTLSLHSSLNVRDHASYPYCTTGNIIAREKSRRQKVHEYHNYDIHTSALYFTMWFLIMFIHFILLVFHIYIIGSLLSIDLAHLKHPFFKLSYLESHATRKPSSIERSIMHVTVMEIFSLGHKRLLCS